MEQEEAILRPLAPEVKTVWRIKLGLFWLLVFGGAVTYETITYFGADDRWLPFGTTALIVLLVGSALTIFLPNLRYRFWRFDLRQEELYLERGILNRVRTVVPLRRIQHLDVSQDIVEREFELGKLIVHTAGSRSSEVVLPGLRYDDAQALRDELKHYVLEDAV